ncbi:stress protein [Sphingobacterium mizutaii]|uniref:stress protein n=1 Tax=Sphingobacterium mizutaii TaxID=1010 RepID=UPI0028AA2DFF|nr:stress protein [Sphingobacterium mizutaii]
MAINLQKITLEKRGESCLIDLSKKINLLNEKIGINLNWSKTVNKGFWGSLFAKNIDLDLGCYFELNNSEKNVIDGLQFSRGRGGDKNILTKQGRYTDRPWIWHSGDDRGVANGSGENILVNPKGLSDLKRITVYCFIYEGVANWNETNAVVTVNIPGIAEIEVKLGDLSSNGNFCAIAEILFTTDSISVKKLVSFHSSHADCDKTYNWGLKWGTGSK